MRLQPRRHRQRVAGARLLRHVPQHTLEPRSSGVCAGEHARTYLRSSRQQKLPPQAAFHAVELTRTEFGPRASVGGHTELRHGAPSRWRDADSGAVTLWA